MKLLIYGNRKQDDEIYEIDTPEKESAAYLTVFGTLDDYWGCYQEIDSRHQKWLKQARAGDWQAAKKLMNARKDYEYEEFHLAETIDATKIPLKP